MVRWYRGMRRTTRQLKVAGTVLEVEGTYATRYSDLAHWFAGQVALCGSLQKMQDRAMRRSAT